MSTTKSFVFSDWEPMVDDYEHMTQEEMLAWRQVAESNFNWLREKSKEEKDSAEKEWATFVLYNREVWMALFDRTFAPKIKAVQQGKWNEVHHSVVINTHAIKVPTLRDVPVAAPEDGSIQVYIDEPMDE